jgi:hypothetical protein
MPLPDDIMSVSLVNTLVLLCTRSAPLYCLAVVHDGVMC